jgi:hypothetical protein
MRPEYAVVDGDGDETQSLFDNAATDAAPIVIVNRSMSE